MSSEIKIADFSQLAQGAIYAMKGNLNHLPKEIYADVNKFFDSSVKNYLEFQGKKNSFLKTLLHRIQPVYFFEIYQPIFLKFRGAIIEPKTIEEVFGSQHLVAVIGDAGCGKSMFGKYLFLTAIREANRIPLIVELRYLDLYNKTLNQYINEDIFEKRIATNQNIIERLLKNGKFLIILDGFDEIGGINASKVRDSINKFIEDYPHNYYLLSSRPYANAELLPGFSNFSICPLTSEQIESFIKRQNIDNELAENAIRSIKEEKNDILTSFLQNPLLLSLYLLTYKGNSNIPTKKSIFYRRVVDALFKEHDSLTKLGFERSLKSKLTQEQIEILLQAFSFISYCEGKFGFTKDYVINLVSIIKKTNVSVEFSTELLLDDLKISISLWIEEGNHLYFTHRSLQEYFAVMYVNGIKTQKENIYQIIQNNICTKGAINESRNFLQLLNEVEEYEFNKFLILTNLEKIKSKITGDTAWSIIKIFVRKISFYIGPNGVKFILTRVSETYAFIFDIIQFEFIKEFEAFLLSKDIQAYFTSEINKPVTIEEKSQSNQLEIEINSSKAEELRNLFLKSEGTKNSSELFIETLEKNILIVRQNVETYSNSENMAVGFLLSQIKFGK